MVVCLEPDGANLISLEVGTLFSIGTWPSAQARCDLDEKTLQVSLSNSAGLEQTI